MPPNITLLSLPPYSPELNPMEKVWDYLRQNKLCALVWDSLEEIVEAWTAAWNWLMADPERIESIGTRACWFAFDLTSVHSDENQKFYDDIKQQEFHDRLPALVACATA